MAEQEIVFVFGAYKLDLSIHALFKTDEPVELPPLPFDMLVTLLENAPKLVTRAELYRRHWPDVEVTNNVLDQALKVLRKEFRTQADGDSYIRTVTKQGYRMGIAVERRGRHETKPSGGGSAVESQPTLERLHEALLRGCSQNGIELQNWKTGQELRTYLSESPLQPAAFLTLKDAQRPDGRNRVHFLVETGLAAVPENQFRKTIGAYWQLHATGKYALMTGLRTFRLIILTDTQDDAKRLAMVARKTLAVVARNHFLFGSLENSLANILSDTFLRPDDAARGYLHRLVPEHRRYERG